MCLPVKPYKIEREWKHAGLSCAVVQAREGQFRCGYVRVPSGHPQFGKGWIDCSNDLEVHGGITFGEIEPCSEHEDGQGWWLGFDCTHLGDASYAPDIDVSTASPELVALLDIRTQFFASHFGEHYWTQPEVERETESLADQLAAMA